MREESPNRMSGPTGAVFLSYASQDQEAAQRICEALRAAGIARRPLATHQGSRMCGAYTKDTHSALAPEL